MWSLWAGICFRFGWDWVDIDNSILVHREFERGKSMADNCGPVHVILNRRSLGGTSNINVKMFNIEFKVSFL